MPYTLYPFFFLSDGVNSKFGETACCIMCASKYLFHFFNTCKNMFENLKRSMLFSKFEFTFNLGVDWYIWASRSEPLLCSERKKHIKISFFFGIYIRLCVRNKAEPTAPTMVMRKTHNDYIKATWG